MPVWDVDGWMIGKNPSPVGGGFTVIGNEKTISHQIDQPGITNNHLELLAIGCACYLAEDGDTIRTDSQCAAQWVKVGYCKARPDLSHLAKVFHKWVKTKQLRLETIPREENIAGIYNEDHH